MWATLYRRSLSYQSGTGQLIAMQVSGLRHAGFHVDLWCQRGRLKYWLQSGLRTKKLGANDLHRINGLANHTVIDHGMELTEADIVFSHNLMSAATRYLSRPELEVAADNEARYFEKLSERATIVANSNLVRDELIAKFAIAASRIRVCYPGYRDDVFNCEQRRRLRRQARQNLAIADNVPLVGFVTSGDLHKRGFGVFLDTAEEIRRQDSRIRFLIVGSKQLPHWAYSHPIVGSGVLMHRPRGPQPARWMAALDIFLYPARFEEFGMVIPEASALGVPVLTSRRVGASEILSTEFRPWILDEPSAMSFAEMTLRLLADVDAQNALSKAGIAAAETLTAAHYAANSLALIRALT